MTHGGGDGSDTDVDEHLIYEGPHGIHFDSLEGKWLLVAILVAHGMVLTGSVELLAVVGPIALGVRQTQRLPKLSQLEPQPWWFCGGLLVGYPIALIERAVLEYAGVPMPDVQWARAIDVGLDIVQALA